MMPRESLAAISLISFGRSEIHFRFEASREKSEMIKLQVRTANVRAGKYETSAGTAEFNSAGRTG